MGPQRPVWTGAEYLVPAGIRSRDLPASSDSYRLNYSGPHIQANMDDNVFLIHLNLTQIRVNVVYNNMQNYVKNVQRNAMSQKLSNLPPYCICA